MTGQPRADLPGRPPTLGPVSGDGLAQLFASRFAKPSSISLWALAAEAAAPPHVERLARELREDDDPATAWEHAEPRHRNYWRAEARHQLRNEGMTRDH